MKNRIIALVMMVFLLQLGGCNEDTYSINNNNDKTIVPSNDESNLNEKLIIYNKKQVIGEIYHFGNIMQIDDGIVYSKWSDRDGSNTVMEYYCYNYNDNKSVQLGKINEWSLQTQETAYINNHIYFFVSTGDITSYDNRELKLMDIDLEHCVMS